MTSRDPRAAGVIVLVADGIRPDTLMSAISTGRAPALAQLRAEGALHTVTSVFPSVTGPAYAPFLMGRYPGSVGLPGLRWFDREGHATSRWHRTRSYVGVDFGKVDTDLDSTTPTVFELAQPALGALHVIGRGLPPQHRIGGSLGFGLYALATHLRGGVDGWLAIDRRIADQFAHRVQRDRPAFAFCALTGIDKASHATGHNAPKVYEALSIVDALAGRLRDDALRDGRWERTHLWVVSDHGHSPVTQHDDLATHLRHWGLGVRAHPWVMGANHDAAVMVSGNAMAHLYVNLRERTRQWWPAHAARWQWLADRLLELPSVDLLLFPMSDRVCEVRARGRGGARIVRERDRWAYRPETGDPLGIGPLEGLTPESAWDATAGSDYPDAIVQALALAASARAGDIIASGARGWDFRAKWEPIPHVSSHGALHRDHMMVPLLLNQPAVSQPRRTVDVMPSALSALHIRLPAGLDGTSFR